MIYLLDHLDLANCEDTAGLDLTFLGEHYFSEDLVALVHLEVWVDVHQYKLCYLWGICS